MAGMTRHDRGVLSSGESDGGQGGGRRRGSGPQPEGPAQAARRAAGERLKQRRQALGLSQTELAYRIGYSRNTISDAETKGAGAAALWERADLELAAGGELTALYTAARAAAASVAASQGPARLRAVPRPAPPGQAAGPDPAVVSPGSCPHCGALLLLQTSLAGTAAPGG